MKILTVAASTWTFGINDPSLIAWVIFGVFFAVAYLCWRARTNATLALEPRIPLLWTILSIALILLGVNKQLDLHRLIMDVGRDLVAAQAWRSYSPVLLGVFVTSVVVLGVFVLLFGINGFRVSNRELRIAYGTLIGLLAAQVVRFLPGPIAGILVTHIFADEGLFHTHLIEFLELGCLGMIGFVARADARRNVVCIKQKELEQHV